MTKRPEGLERVPGYRESTQAPRSRRLGLLMSLLALAGSVAGFPPAVEANDFAQLIFTPHFSLANPGARSLGLGGAFVALADDATAALANPAGLVQLARPEVSIEGRHWSYSTPYTAGGNAQGSPTGIGLDTQFGLRTAISSDDSTGLSFLSFVYPWKRWSFALYRHLYLKYESTAATQGLFKDGTFERDRYFDQVATSDALISSYGFSTAFRISDSFSLGFGIVLFDADVTMKASVYRQDNLDDLLGSPTSFQPEDLMTTSTLTQRDRDLGLTGGFLWRFAPSWTLGGKFREGPEIETGGAALFGPANRLGLPPGFEIEVDDFPSARYPDTYSLGVAHRSPNGRWTGAFEWDRITYSDMPRSMEIWDQTVEDGDEIHLGGEYVFLGSRPLLALRAGVWLDPDHVVRATSDNPYAQALLRPVGDKMHYAIGFGMAFERFQLDGALDFSDLVDTVALSAILSF
ncbi:MAG: outer membrane protein transport protein [Thermoanaerobaculia bacterium]